MIVIVPRPPTAEIRPNLLPQPIIEDDDLVHVVDGSSPRDLADEVRPEFLRLGIRNDGTWNGEGEC